MEQGVRPRTLPGANPESPGELGTPKAGGGIGILSGILGSILQYAAFCKISEDLNKAMNCDKPELQVRWWAQLSAMIGATMETLGKLLAKIPTWAMGGEMVAGLTLGVLKYGGIALGAVGGFISAGMDFVKGWEAKNRGQVSLAVCFFVSSFLQQLD